MSNAATNIVAKFAPMYEGPYDEIETTGSNLKIVKSGKVQVLNIDHVRIYKDRK